MPTVSVSDMTRDEDVERLSLIRLHLRDAEPATCYQTWRDDAAAIDRILARLERAEALLRDIRRQYHGDVWLCALIDAALAGEKAPAEAPAGERCLAYIKGYRCTLLDGHAEQHRFDAPYGA